ncbi:MAG TPA: hypothetical protein VGL39_28120 [Jatrophihabitantaceae bacterium]|jgi:hypothetical protein
MTRRLDSTVVLLDRDSDDGALCGRPSRFDPRSRYLLALGRPGADTPAVALAPADAARLVAALGAWLAEATDDDTAEDAQVADGRVAA